MNIHHLIYIDPGSGGLLFQLAISGVVGFIAFLKIYWNKIKSIFKGTKKE